MTIYDISISGLQKRSTKPVGWIQADDMAPSKAPYGGLEIAYLVERRKVKE